MFNYDYVLDDGAWLERERAAISVLKRLVPVVCPALALTYALLLLVRIAVVEETRPKCDRTTALYVTTTATALVLPLVWVGWHVGGWHADDGVARDEAAMRQARALAMFRRETAALRMYVTRDARTGRTYARGHAHPCLPAGALSAPTSLPCVAA
jgi:hypothetical protein